MAPNSNDMITVEAKALEQVVVLMRSLMANTFSDLGQPTCLVGTSLVQLQQNLLDHKRMQEGPETINLGDIVEPKVGRNTLRAGGTAYERAVVIEVTPFHIAAIDGKCAWGGARPDDFIVVGAVESDVLEKLVTKWVD